jgi:hypothetical protein
MWNEFLPISMPITAGPVLEYHHSDPDAFVPIQYIIRSESVRFP